MAKSKKQLADEAWERSMEALDGRAPVPEGAIVGQLDIDGSVVGTSGREIEHPIKGVPRFCPGCDAEMDVVYGGSWNAMLRSERNEAAMLQCGKCAHIVTVSLAVWEAVREERRRTIGRKDAKPPVKLPKKQRGAG